jgi:hypothetical protein
MFISAENTGEPVQDQFIRLVSAHMPPGFKAVPKYNSTQLTGWDIVPEHSMDPSFERAGIEVASKQLNQAYAAAIRIHGNHYDKAGLPEMLHVSDVSNRLVRYGAEVQVIGLLHDSLEYMSIDSVNELMGYFPLSPMQKDAITILHRHHNASYDYYIHAIMTCNSNAIATLVKVADLKSNTDPDRMGLIPGFAQGSLAKRYFKALKELEGEWMTYRHASE